MASTPPANPAPDVITVLDLSGLLDADLADPRQARRAWDTLHAAASLQGIVNRERPRLWLRFEPDVEDYWWRTLREPGAWLADAAVETAASVEEALLRFRAAWRGVVLYRETPWAGSNAASTIAGVEDRVALRHDDDPVSLYQQLRRTGVWDEPDELRLFTPDGTPVWHDQSEPTEKTRAHRWLIARCLRTGQVSPNHLAYYIDSYWLMAPTRDTLPNCTLTNHDYFISHRALFLDLHVWEEESPVDDPAQPPGRDLELLREVLKLQQRRAAGMIHVGGFTPWRWKYSDQPGAGSAHDGVQTEWKMVKEVSAYNGYLDADAISYAGMTNASFYQHFPLRAHYPQVATPAALGNPDAAADVPADATTSAEGRDRPTFVMLYTGDYDAAAWLNRLIPRWWTDPARGTVPINWAFNPNLDARAPHALHHARTRASPRDCFVAGDCGAGYLNPAQLTAPRPDPDVPDGWDAWTRHCRDAYRRYDLTVTGFIIEGLTDGIGPRGLDAYAGFSPDGLIAHRKLDPHGLHRSGMPYLRMTADLGGCSDDAAAALLDHLRVEDATTPFFAFRTVVQSPGWHADLIRTVNRSRPDVRFLDARDFMARLRRHLQEQAAALSATTSAAVVVSTVPASPKRALPHTI